MIYFVVGAIGSFSIRYYLAEEGLDLADRMRVIEYDDLPRMRSLPIGTWVFTEADTRTEPERELVALAWDGLSGAGAGVRLMNHPHRIASRLELLRAAHEAGRNRFRAVRASAVSSAELRFPVFVRWADRHDGSLTPLLHSPRELRRALGGFVAARNALDRLLVVEFCDTRDERGVYRKYSAFKVGDRILPRVLECSRDWMVKWEYRIFDDERAAEESCYLATNPHEAWIREMFSLAGVDYGRIDYGVLDGQPQVWEINTNPTIGRPPGPRIHDPVVIAYKRSLSPGYESFYEGFLEAWRELDCGPEHWQQIDSATAPNRELELEPPEPSRANVARPAHEIDFEARDVPRAIAARHAHEIDFRPPPELLRAVDTAREEREAAARREARFRSLVARKWMRPLVRVAKSALGLVAAARVRGSWHGARGEADAAAQGELTQRPRRS